MNKETLKLLFVLYADMAGQIRENIKEQYPDYDLHRLMQKIEDAIKLDSEEQHYV